MPGATEGRGLNRQISFGLAHTFNPHPDPLPFMVEGTIRINDCATVLESTLAPETSYNSLSLEGEGWGEGENAGILSMLDEIPLSFYPYPRVVFHIHVPATLV